MRTRSLLALGFVLALSLGSIAQQPRPQVRSTTAEFQLIGVRLFDSGARVVSLYGSPDDIFGITMGGGGSGGPGGGGPGGGGGGGGASGGGGGGGGNGPAAGAASGTSVVNYPDVIGDPFNMGTGNARQFRPGEEDGRDNRGGGGGNLSPAGDDGGGANPGGGGGANAGGEQSSRVTLTRWVYKRQNAHYAFIFDKFNRVVQIEALGVKDTRVRTRKGMGFGNTVQQLIQKYGAPDAYEVGGQHIVLRFLVKDRVAFRLSRLRANDKHRVTGVVIAAAKS